MKLHKCPEIGALKAMDLKFIVTIFSLWDRLFLIGKQVSTDIIQSRCFPYPENPNIFLDKNYSPWYASDANDTVY